MPYVLGVDVGTSYTTAAMCRLDRSTWRETEVVRLTSDSVAVPSVLYLGEDGTAVVGAAAQQRAAAQPARIARGFSHRVGDDVPLVVGGAPYSAAELTALLVGWVLDRVTAREGEPAEQVVLTHPAGWAAYRQGALHQELLARNFTNVTLLPEPIGAGESYVSRDRLDVDAQLAVLSMGARHTESALVRRTGSGAFELLAASSGQEENPEELAGNYLDELLLNQVRAELGPALAGLDSTDPRVRLTLSRLLHECTRAKERLSSVDHVTVPVALPGSRVEIPVARAVFEELIRPSLRGVVATLLDMLRRDAAPARPAAVVLVGGSVRIPLVAELVSEALDCRVAVEAKPQTTAAKGAALAARRLTARRRSGVAIPMPERQTTLLPRIGGGLALRSPKVRGVGSADTLEPPPRPAVEVVPLTLPRPRGVGQLVPGVRPGVLGAAVIVVVLLGVALTFILHLDIGPRTPTGPRTGVSTPVRRVGDSMPSSVAGPLSGGSSGYGG